MNEKNSLWFSCFFDNQLQKVGNLHEKKEENNDVPLSLKTLQEVLECVENHR